MFSAIQDQQALSRHLLRSGAIMFLGGLIFGLTIYSSQYPRIALYVHVEGTSYGHSLITIGLMISQVAFVGRLERWELFVIWLSQITAWPMWLSQIAQSFWGTNQMNRIVANPLSLHLLILSRSLRSQKHPGRRRGKKTWFRPRILLPLFRSLDGLLLSRR